MNTTQGTPCLYITGGTDSIIGVVEKPQGWIISGLSGKDSTPYKEAYLPQRGRIGGCNVVLLTFIQ